MPSSQCIGGCVNDLTLIPYNYSTSCNNGVFAPFACVDTKEIERCEVDVNYVSFLNVQFSVTLLKQNF